MFSQTAPPVGLQWHARDGARRWSEPRAVAAAQWREVPPPACPRDVEAAVAHSGRGAPRGCPGTATGRRSTAHRLAARPRPHAAPVNPPPGGGGATVPRGRPAGRAVAVTPAWRQSYLVPSQLRLAMTYFDVRLL